MQEKHVRCFKALNGGVWHVTTPDRFQGILQESAILANPNLPDDMRWSTASFPSMARRLGAISVFDLRAFNYRSHYKKHGGTGWTSFMPTPRDCSKAVWIQIDIAKVGSDFISAREMVEKSRAGVDGNFIAFMEGAIQNKVETSAFSRVLEYCNSRKSFIEIDLKLVSS